MKKCELDHRYEELFEELPYDQGGNGRHKCAACAYQQGYDAGFGLQQMTFDLSALPTSQAGTIRHKSPHAAYALGYFHGVKAFYACKEAVRRTK
jgi:hypothetical protein